MNRVIERTLNGTTTYYIYDGWGLIEERDGLGNILVTYTHGLSQDEILSKISSSNTVYYHQNALGSVIDLTDNTGTVVEKYKYDAYGKPAIMDGSGNPLMATAYGNRFLFTGREYLAEVGIYDYRSRGYSVDLGKFLQIDTIRNQIFDDMYKDSLDKSTWTNLYCYAVNNPVNLTDPLGLDAVFTFTNGTTASTTTADGFMSLANSPAAANGGIANITVDGHANSNAQTFSLNDTHGTGSQIDLDSDGVVALRSSNSAPGIPLSNILNGRLSPNASIVYRGCHAGANGGVAQATSAALGTNTVGSPGPVVENTYTGTDTAASGYNSYSNGAPTGHFSTH